MAALTVGAWGTAGLGVALVLAVLGLALAVAGARTARPQLVGTAGQVAVGVLAVLVLVNGAMLAALLRNDFAVRYVAENSSRATPVFYKVLALWAADDGSLLLWNLVLAGYLVVVVWRFRRTVGAGEATYPYALAVLFAIQAFYLLLVNGPARPFGATVAVPADGRGPAPLLQNHPLMAVHPPFLYLGFIGFTVPFAFGVAALIADAPDDWLRLVRRWTLAVWCFLTVGLTLGALWSYSVLGWGGYWAWDPVENVALLPWLVSTAFLHSVMLQQRRGMARVWNLALVIAAFALTTFGTFLTRGSVLSSIHAFTETAVGPAYLSFLGLVLVGGYGLLVWRLPALRSPAALDSLASREAAFVGNNVLLLSAAAIVLLGTVFPLAVEAVGGAQLTVGGPYFRAAVTPVFLLLLLLVGAAPLLPWRTANRDRTLARLRAPVVAAAAVTVACALAGLRDVTAVVGFALVGFVLVGNGGQLLDAALVARRRRRGGRHRPPAGRRAGLVVHVGLALLAAGIIASSAFAQQAEVTLRAGHSTTFAGYRLRYVGLETDRQAQRTVLTTPVSVTRPSGASGGVLDPRLNLYPAASEPIGSPSIQRGVVWDLYASVIGLQDEGASATFRLYRNPGVSWLWLGALVMALGGASAWWGRRLPRPGARS